MLAVLLHLTLQIPVGLPGPAVSAPTAPPGLPRRPPAEAGMSPERLALVDQIVRKGIDAGAFPGAALVVGKDGAIVWEKGYGRLGWTGTSERVNPDSSIYDLASLTKVVGVTTATMMLLDAGKLTLDDKVSSHLPEFTGEMRERITVRMLLTHTSGLPAGSEVWKRASNPTEARRLLLAARPFCEPGKCMLYSDIGPDILGFVVERVSGMKLDAYLEAKLFQPLGMSQTVFRPAKSLQPRIAPTETNPPRGYPIRGEVHDEAAFALGGVAGHAGLFASATDLAVFAQMLLNSGEIGGVRVVAESTVRLFTRRVVQSRALGWDTAHGEAGAGTFLTERAFGHSGFTGTSIWIDPDRKLFVILLTNRVHQPRTLRSGYMIADVRNDIMDATVLSILNGPDGVLQMPAAFRTDTSRWWNSRSGGYRLP